MILLNSNVCPSVPSDQIQTTISFPWLFPFIGSISAGSSALCKTLKLLCFRFLIRHCWAIGSQPAWSPNSDSRTVHVRPWCLLKAGWYQLSIDQRLGQFSYSIIKFCVYFRWHLKICSSPACNPFLVGSIRGPPGTPIHPFAHFYMGNIYNLLCIVSQTRRWNHTHAKATLAHTRLNHGPPRKADTPRGQFIEKNNEKR